MTGTRALLVDLDGTLALNESGRPWYGDGYEKRLHEDKVNHTVRRVINALVFPRSGVFAEEVLFVSGRMEVGREATTAWLAKECGYIMDEDPANLFMRADGDYRPDVEVKTDLYNAHIRDVYDVYLALDDKPEIIALWRSLGIPAWQVNDYR